MSHLHQPYMIAQVELLSAPGHHELLWKNCLWAELEAQLKARQSYEQATGDASWRHGAAFWDLRGQKG